MTPTSESKTPPRRPRALARALAVGCGLLAACAVAELGFRALHYGPGALTPAGIESIRPLGMSGLVRGSDVWELRFELVPDARARFKLARFETNAHGLRDEPCTLAKPAGTRRIAFVGDSFTMGSGVELGETFHSRIEARLAERGRGAWECLNFGVGGYNLLSYVGVLRERALAFEPDLVVVCLTANDLKKPPQRPDLAPYVPRPVVHPFWASHLLAHLRGRPLYEDDERADLGGAGRADTGPADAGATAPHGRGADGPGPDHRGPGAAGPGTTGPGTTGPGIIGPDAPGPERTGADEAPIDGAPAADDRAGTPLSPHFEALRELAAEAGAELAIVYLNLAQEPYFRDVAPRLIRAEAAAIDAPFYDTTPLFEGRDPREFWIFPDDAHPDAAAHGLLAEGIIGFLHRRGLLGP